MGRFVIWVARNNKRVNRPEGKTGLRVEGVNLNIKKEERSLSFLCNPFTPLPFIE
jgi:hypothetical protein